MNDGQRIFMGLIGAAILGAGIFMGLKYISPDGEFPGSDIEVSKRSTAEENLNPEDGKKQEEEKTKEYVNVYFIGVNENNEEVYKAVQREFDKDVDGSKVKFALTSLVSGPKANEKAKGVYSEIPAGTRVISIQETPDKVIVNLTSEFEQGGGTDSLYKRLYQLIKTAKKNTSKPVYLYLNGKQADVIGGEGIMITQPLNNGSLDG